MLINGKSLAHFDMLFLYSSHSKSKGSYLSRKGKPDVVNIGTLRPTINESLQVTLIFMPLDEPGKVDSNLKRKKSCSNLMDICEVKGMMFRFC